MCRPRYISAIDFVSSFFFSLCDVSRKKSRKSKEKVVEKAARSSDVPREDKKETAKAENEVKRTPAEMAFQKMQEKMVRQINSHFSEQTNSYSVRQSSFVRS